MIHFADSHTAQKAVIGRMKMAQPYTLISKMSRIRVAKFQTGHIAFPFPTPVHNIRRVRDAIFDGIANTQLMHLWLHLRRWELVSLRPRS